MLPGIILMVNEWVSEREREREREWERESLGLSWTLIAPDTCRLTSKIGGSDETSKRHR